MLENNIKLEHEIISWKELFFEQKDDDQAINIINTYLTQIKVENLNSQYYPAFF